MNGAPIVGYFAWVRNQHDEATYEKRDIDIRKGAQPENIKRRVAVTIKEFPLDASLWDCELHHLAKTYPCPDRKEWPRQEEAE